MSAQQLAAPTPAAAGDDADRADLAELAELTGTLARSFAASPTSPAVIWERLAGADILGACLPETAGGAGFGLRGHCAVLAQLGQVPVVTTYRDAIAAAAEALAAWGSPAQQGLLADIVAGRTTVATAWRAPASAEAAAAGGVVALAEGDGDGWRLTGALTMVQGGLTADLLLVEAGTASGTGVFVVQGTAPGVTRQRQDLVDSIIGGESAWVDLTDVRVSGADRLGGPDDDVAGWIRVRRTLAACAEQTGVLKGAVRQTARYVAEREQFGRPLGAFQAVSQRLADAAIDVRATELAVAEAIRAIESPDAGPEQAGAAVATAAYWAAEAGHRVAHTCVHLHGGAGIDLDHPAHRYFAAAKRLEFDLGGAITPLRDLGRILADG